MYCIVLLVIVMSITSCSYINNEENQTLDNFEETTIIQEEESPEIDTNNDNSNVLANNNEQAIASTSNEQTRAKIYALANIEEANGEWDKSVMGDFCQEPIIGQGFVYKSSDTKWVLDIINIGDMEAKNIEIKYTIIAYERMFYLALMKLT